MHSGGMHCVMSFLGCIDKLMKISGLEELICSSIQWFDGYIINGKNWPWAMRALRMVCTVLLSDFLYKEGSIPTFEDKACKTPTGQLWVDCLIRPTLIAHMFIRAQREGDWLLHGHCYQNMLPYFLAAGHWHYARLITCKKWAVCLRRPSLILWLVLLYVDIEKVCGTQSQQISLGNKLIYAMANLKVVSLASASELSRLHAGFSLIVCVSVCLSLRADVWIYWQ